MKDDNQLLTIRQIARRTHRDYATVRYWIDMGWLPSVPTPRGWRLVPQAALERFLAEGAPKKPTGQGGA